FDIVACGGTFDHLHSGHKILLTSAVWLASKKLICGVYDFSTNEARLGRKKASALMETLDFRLKRVLQFLRMMKIQLEYDVVPITDDYGPTKDDPAIQAIVGSLETEQGCYAVNTVRKEQSLSPLEVFLVDLVSPSDAAAGDMAAKLSSSEIREHLQNKA
ncbi:hypothetical protein BC829DRAFT_359656, partial [Chytridium lagenaria]